MIGKKKNDKKEGEIDKDQEDSRKGKRKKK